MKRISSKEARLVIALYVWGAASFCAGLLLPQPVVTPTEAVPRMQVMEVRSDAGPVTAMPGGKDPVPVPGSAEESGPSSDTPDIATATDPLYRAYLVRKALDGVESVEELRNSPIAAALRSFAATGDEYAVYDVLRELVLSGRPLALEYVGELVLTPKDLAAASAAVPARQLAYLASTALFAANGNAADQTLKSLYARACAAQPEQASLPSPEDSGGDSRLAREEMERGRRATAQASRWALIHAAMESGTALGESFYWDAFSEASPEDKVDFVSAATHPQQTGAHGGPARDLVRQCLVSDDSVLRQTAIEGLLHIRQEQTPGGFIRADTLLAEAFEGGDATARLSILEDLDRLVEEAASANSEPFRISGIERLALYAAESSDAAIEASANALLAHIEECSRVEENLSMAQEDTRWLHDLIRKQER